MWDDEMKNLIENKVLIVISLISVFCFVVVLVQQLNNYFGD